MSRCLRYQNPIVIEHLASQYTAGHLSTRVRSRTEALVLKIPELDRAIAQWTDAFSLIHIQVSPPVFTEKKQNLLWQGIDKQTIISVEERPSVATFWQNIFAWKLAAGFSTLTTVILVAILWFSVSTPNTNIATGPDYLANMHAHGDPERNIEFVISAYAKNTDMPSRLYVQWLQSQEVRVIHPPLHLWAENKETLELVYIGIQPENGRNWNLTKAAWQAVINSRRLLMTTENQQPADNNIIFSGICLQLKQWKS
jgi:hypothetical protein